MANEAELVARIFFDTMYPSQNWEALPTNGNTRTVLMHAANKALAALMPPLMKLDPKTGAVTLFEDQPTSDWPVNYKEQFWAKYPHKIGKGDALKVLERLRGKTDRPAWVVLMAGIDRYMATKPLDRPWCNPSTFLNGMRWADQPAPTTHGGMNGAAREPRQAGFGQDRGQGGLASYALSRARDSGQTDL